MARKGHRGFTLIELMIVVLIVVVFAAIVTPKLVEVSDRNRLDEVANDIQQLAVDVRALAMRTRRAVVLEVRGDRLWVNALAGQECGSDIAKRCILDMGKAANNAGTNVYNLRTQENLSAHIALCHLRAAAWDDDLAADPTCTVTDIQPSVGFAVCYTGSGSLFVRLSKDDNTECTATSAPDANAVWHKGCAPFSDPGNSAPENDFSGAQIYLQRFDTGTGTCPPGGPADSNAVGLARVITIPAGGHPTTAIPGL